MHKIIITAMLSVLSAFAIAEDATNAPIVELSIQVTKEQKSGQMYLHELENAKASTWVGKAGHFGRIQRTYSGAKAVYAKDGTHVETVEAQKGLQVTFLPTEIKPDGTVLMTATVHVVLSNAMGGVDTLDLDQLPLSFPVGSPDAEFPMLTGDGALLLLKLNGKAI